MIQINSAKRLSYRISLYIYSAMSAQNEMPPRPAATPREGKMYPTFPFI